MKTITIDPAEERNVQNRRALGGYPIQVSALPEEEGGGFQALFAPLARSVVGYGATAAEAIADLQAACPAFLELMAETGQTLPNAVAEKEWEAFSGKFNVRVAKVVHAQLVELAEEQGVSLNSLVQTLLTAGASALAAGKTFGAIERTVVRPQSLYLWEEQSVPTIKVHDARSFFAREKSQDEWLLAQEG